MSLRYDDTWEPGRWYRLVNPLDGSLWMETSDINEAVEEQRRSGNEYVFQRLWIRSDSEWRDET